MFNRAFNVYSWCQYDHLLHPETLESDFVALLGQYGLPLLGLPRINPTKEANHKDKLTPPVVFTRDALRIINDVDDAIFTQFGYTKRHDEFEL